MDLIDASSGGNVAGARIPVEPGYQVAFAERIRKEAGLLTGAVGMITTAEQAELIIQSGQADLVLLAANSCVILIFRYMPPRAWGCLYLCRSNTFERFPIA